MSYTTECSGYRIILDQKRQYALFNVAPPRAETISPYSTNPNLTKAQFDMRRKAEILKHSNNRQNTKTNNLTKKQHWAMLARGNGTRISQYAIQAQNDPFVSGFEVIDNATILDVGTIVIVNGIGYRIFGDEFDIGTRVLINGPGYNYNNMTRFVEVNFSKLGQSYSSENFIGPDSTVIPTISKAYNSESNLTVQHDGSYGTIIDIFQDNQQYKIAYDAVTSDIVDFASMTLIKSSALPRIPYTHVNSSGTIVNALDENQYTVQYSDTTTDVVNKKYITAIRISPYKCLQDITKPTWTSACDVPGPLMKLYMDPTVPLYGLNSQPAISGQGNAGSGEGVQIDGGVKFRFYTENELEYVFKEVEVSSQPDTVNDTILFQTRSSRIGQIVTTDRTESSLYNFEFSIPIGIWFYGSTGLGVLNTQTCPTLATDELDLSYNPHLVDVSNSKGETVQVKVEYDNTCYQDKDISDVFRFPGAFLPEDTIRMHIISENTNINGSRVNPFDLSVTYSGVKIPVTPTFEQSFNDVTFSAYEIEPGHFYGVQYVGNMIVRDLSCQVQPQQVFNLDMTMKYTYNTNVSNLFDYFKTGIFVNLSQENQYAADGMTFTSPPRFPFIESTFTNYTPGSIIPKRTPSLAIKSIQFGNIGPTFVNIRNIVGNYDSYTVHRISLVGPTHDISSNFQNLTESIFYDSGLTPDTSYTYFMTPVFNNMNGSLYQIGTIRTPKLTFIVDDPIVTATGICFPNIRGNFSSYTVQKDVSAVTMVNVGMQIVSKKINVTTITGHLTMPSYTTTELISPGLTYQYTFTPYSFNTKGKALDPFLILTPNPVITHAAFGIISYNSVEIKDISGVFDSYCVVRDGIPSRAALINKPANNAKITSYVDVGNGLIPGNSYKYSIIPTFDKLKVDGIRYYLPNSVIIPL